MKIALMIPSRGLVRAQTMESVDRCLKNFDHLRFFSHDRPIPDCFYHLADRFLESNCTHGWFVEEDVVPPDNAVELLLACDSDIAAIHYPIRNGSVKHKVARGEVAGKIIWTGFGCTLIRRTVFESLEKPWFRTDMEAVAVHEGSASSGYKLMLRTRTRQASVGYGGQDLYFGVKAVMNGFTIGEVKDVKARHLTQEERNESEEANCSNRSKEFLPQLTAS